MADPGDLLLDVAREAERRYYGKHRGLVTDNDDPARRGRLRLQIPSVLGAEETGWALPCAPYGGAPDSGLFILPEVGAQVWVEFEMGELHNPIWVGTFWPSPPDESGEGDLGNWRVRTLRTAKGQMLRLEDTDGATQVLLRHGSGAELRIEDSGTVRLTDGRGQTLTLDSGGRLLAEDGNGNRVQLTSSGVVAADAAGNAVELAAAGVTVKGSVVTVDAPLVQLGGPGGEPLLKGTSFLAAYMLHTHGSGAGPTTPPVPTTETSALSTKVLTQ